MNFLCKIAKLPFNKIFYVEKVYTRFVDANERSIHRSSVAPTTIRSSTIWTNTRRMATSNSQWICCSGKVPIGYLTQIKKVMNKIMLILLLAVVSCEKKVEYPSPFDNRLDGEFMVSMQLPKDNNGYYHFQFNPSKDFEYTNVYSEASAVTNERYLYNGVSVIEGAFDSDSYWILGENIGVKIPLYNPFRSLYSSPYFTSPLPVGTRSIVLAQYKNSIVEVVQPTKVYFKKYDSRMDEYIPKGNNLWAKRIIGPIPKYMRSDTLKIYANIMWECGNYTITYPERTHKLDSLNLIIE